MDLHIARFFIRVARPVNLLGGLLLYILGVGIARYLGNSIDWAVVILGGAWVATFQLGFNYLAAYFTLPNKPGDFTRFPIKVEGDENHEGVRRDLVLWSAFTGFAVAASLSLILTQSSKVNNTVLILNGMIFLGAILYSVPPFKLATSGYGEFILSITSANLIPAFGFVLQGGDIPRLVTMCTFPLTMLHLAMMLATQLSDYALNVKKGRNNLMIRLGWERGMRFHNLLILGAFALISVAMYFGLPSTVALPIFFVMPLGLFQIWYMTRISAGAKPNWRVLNLTAIFTFGFTAYLFTLLFWIR